MKKAGMTLVVLLMISVQSWSQDRELKVITFNIRYDNPADGINRWDNRKQMVADLLQQESPDLIGLQEVLAHQLDYLSVNLPEYDHTGVGRDDGKKAGEFSPVFYKKERFTLLDSGTFWLSPAPGDTASVGWDAALTRICTWALLLDHSSTDTILFLNTHFDHVGEEARLESARLIKSFTGNNTGWNSAILTGDFNCTPADAPYEILTRGDNSMTDACRDYASAENEMTGTFNGFDHAGSGERIDMIFFRGGWKTSHYEVKKVKKGEVFISDHFPVVSVLSAK